MKDEITYFDVVKWLYESKDADLVKVLGDIAIALSEMGIEGSGFSLDDRVVLRQASVQIFHAKERITLIIKSEE
jgi:hypothetical protein